MKALHPLYFIPSTTSPLLHPLAVFTSYPPAWALPRGPFSCKYFSLAPAPTTPSENPHAGPHYNRHSSKVGNNRRLPSAIVSYGPRIPAVFSTEEEHRGPVRRKKPPTGICFAFVSIYRTKLVYHYREMLEIRGKTWLVLWWEMNRWMQRKLFGSVLNM
ncbi:unnamed protein product [Nesidiocoris tenuis]|uniref:Uncharacterized protein n=1 Tax=Nesidiocoris tenuis TaxID=355587 RepID=A0A6H5GNY4_9HEMI|nr:unnamed protein product [Nesidiocoris tenuis]